MIIPGVISCQSTIEATIVYSTRFLTNFESGDGTTPSIDDTGARTTTYNQCEVDSSNYKFGSGGLASVGSNGEIFSDFSNNLNVGGKAFTFECFGKNQSSFDLFNIAVNLTSHNISVTPIYNQGTELWKFRLYRFMSSDPGTATAFSSEIYNQAQMEDWNHFALEGDGLGNFFFYFNGDEVVKIEDGVDVDSVNLTKISVGCRNILTPSVLTSFRDSIRLVIGERVYNGEFTPPNEALTEIQGYTYG